MSRQVNTNVAHAILLLKMEPESPRVMHAVILLETALPPAGTVARREAFAAAYERINKNEEVAA